MAGDLKISTINNAGFTSNNLVINPEFTVNQRVAASRTAATGYNFDRWYYDGTNLLQGIENLNVRNTTYVVSWEGSSTCSYSLNTASSSSQGGQSYTSVANGGLITVSSLNSNNLWLKFNGSLTTLNKVKLVEGDVVSNFVSRLHPQEMALCQRYLPVWDSTGGISYATGQASNGSSGYVPLIFPVTPRVVPTGVSTSGAVASMAVTNSAAGQVALTSLNFNSAGLNSSLLQIGVASGLASGNAFLLNPNGLKIFFTGCEL